MFDLLRYVIVCLLFTSAGFGLIRWLRVQLDADLAVLVGAPIAQAIVTTCLGLAVIAGWPLKQVTLPLWGVLLIPAVYGVRAWTRESDDTSRRLGTMLWGTSLLTAPLVMLPFFVVGLDEYPSGPLDGWAYAALGQLLWAVPRDTTTGLTAVHEFAVHLGHTRFISSSELSFLSWLWAPGDTQAANGLLRALSIFGLASAAGAFARLRGLAPRFAIVYIAITAVSGWGLNVVWANNYDQGLEMQYFPALAMLAMMLPRLSWPGAVLVGAVAAGALYTYPEFALLGIGIGALFGIDALRKSRVVPLLTIGVAVLVAAILSMPYWRDSWGFLLNQLKDGLQSGQRPGDGMFPGLLSAKAVLPSLFGLGAEWGGREFLRSRTAGAVALVAVGLAGAWQARRRRESVVLFVGGGFALIIFVLLARQHYPYGAYKALALGWWIAAFIIVRGLIWTQEQLARFGRWSSVTVTAVLSLIVPASTVHRAINDLRGNTNPRMNEYRQIERLPEFLGQVPVALASWDPFVAHWGAYFLRNTDVFLVVRPAYLGMPHVAPYLDAARHAPVDHIRYVITDPEAPHPPAWRLAWGVGRFAVWDTAPVGWTVVTSVRDAGGQDVPPGSSIHAGPPGATVRMMSTRSGRLTLSTRLFNAFLPADDSCYAVTLTTSLGVANDFSLQPGKVGIVLPVPAGASSLRLEMRASASTNGAARAPAREPVLADVNVTLDPAVPSVTEGAHVPSPMVTVPVLTPCASS